MIRYQGKHAELCQAIGGKRFTEASLLIYAFFKSEDNTDSYSFDLLTAVREFLEEGESEHLEKIRLHFRSNADKILINLAQFVLAFEESGFIETATAIAQHCISQFERLGRSMREFDAQGWGADSTRLAARRIQEAILYLSGFFDRREDQARYLRCLEAKFEMGQIFLHDHPVTMLVNAADLTRYHLGRNEKAKARDYAQWILDRFEARCPEMLKEMSEADAYFFKESLEYARQHAS